MATKEELTPILKAIRNSFTASKFFEDELSYRMFCGEMSTYPISIIEQGVQEYIATERGIATLAGISNAVRDVDARQKKIEAENLQYNYRNLRTVKCKKCNDTGWNDFYYRKKIFAKNDEGKTIVDFEYNTASAACDCPIGHETAPWFFQTDEERKRDRNERIKKGENPPYDKPREKADAEFRELFGERISKETYLAGLKEQAMARKHTATSAKKPDFSGIKMEVE